MYCQDVRGSALDTFERCPLWYRFAYDERRPPDTPVPKWAKVGWLVHKALRIALMSGIDVWVAWKEVSANQDDIVREEVHSYLPNFQLKSSDIPKMTGMDFMRIRTMLNRWQNFRVVFNKFECIETEIKFRVQIKRGEEPWWYCGTIDVRARTGNQWLIVDYKSSQPDWEHKSMPLQVWRYGIATAIEHPVEKLEMILFNLESGNQIYDIFDKDKAREIIRHMQKEIRLIRSIPAGKAQAKPGGHCFTLCPYSFTCPFSKRGRVRKHK